MATTQEPIFNKGFNDIEMLEFGDTSSDVESISKSSIPSGLGSEGTEPVVLKEWLESDKTLNFHFNSNDYKQSIDDGSEFSKLHGKYSNCIYKILENLNEIEVKNLEDEYDEQIGLITSDTLVTKQQIKTIREAKLNDSFMELIDNLTELIDGLRSIEYEDIENYECILSIIDCLQANVFFNDINMRPNHLTRWINRFDPQPDEELVTEIMLNSVKPYRHPLFWNRFISKLLIRGLLEQASSAIRESAFEELQHDDPGFYKIIEDFISLIESYSSMSLKGQFADWKWSCCEFRDLAPKLRQTINDPENLMIFEQLHDLTYILTGLPKTISSYCSSWYEILTALSLYQIRDDETLYKEYFNVAIQERPSLDIETDDILKSTERSFLNVLEGSYLHVLTTIDEVDSATSAVISRLMELKGLFVSYYTIGEQKTFDQLMKGKTISEYLLTKFSFQCLNNHNLVPIGIGILLNDHIATTKQSITNNRKIVEEFLPKYQCKTNDDLEWCLAICAKLGAVTTASELYRVYGGKSLKEGYLYEALNMLVNCYNDSGNEDDRRGMKQIHYIIWDLIFLDSLINNRPVNDELINNIVNRKTDPNFVVHPVIKQCLSPYAVLSEFFNSVSEPIPSDTEFILAKNKISRIIHLLEFNHTPKRFFPLLLAQLIPFFINPIYKFQIPDLIVTIELIDNFEQQITTEEFEKAQEIYKTCINNIEEDNKIYDWRQVLKQHNKPIPVDIQELIRFVRTEIVLKTGIVYSQSK